MERREDAHPAQIIIMFAIFATALIGVLGLATDLGISFAGRRSMQNAADAAAYAGTRVVAKAAGDANWTGKTWSEVSTLVANNGFTFASSSPTIACVYVNDSDTSLGDCSGSVPTTATGVKVTVTESHPTYFIRVVPGGPTTATTSATAIAHVEIPAITGGSGPFIVCATDTVMTSGGKMDILKLDGGTWKLNSAAVGKTFNIHEPSPNEFNKCGISSSKYKGVADTDANKDLTAPPAGYFNFKEGDTASVTVSVPGVAGCKAGQPVTTCVAFLPVAIVDSSHPPVESGSDKKIWTIGFAAFYIVQDSSNSHIGTLLDGYIVKGPANLGWTPDYFGPVVIKLTT